MRERKGKKREKRKMREKKDIKENIEKRDKREMSPRYTQEVISNYTRKLTKFPPDKL